MQEVMQQRNVIAQTRTRKFFVSPGCVDVQPWFQLLLFPGQCIPTGQHSSAHQWIPDVPTLRPPRFVQIIRRIVGVGKKKKTKLLKWSAQESVMRVDKLSGSSEPRTGPASLSGCGRLHAPLTKTS